jgi:pyruvate formate lyase activating enzyme
MGYPVKLDTNGSFPDKLKNLVERNLIDYVAMDIKNSIDDYVVTAGMDEKYLEAIEESVSFLKNNKIPFEFRTTVVKHFHTEEGFEKIGKWILGAEKYYLQKFKDSGDLINGHVQGCSDEEMEKFLLIVKKYVPNAKIRG